MTPHNPEADSSVPSERDHPQGSPSITDKQRALLRRLMREREVPDGVSMSSADVDRLGRREASKLIDTLLAQPKVAPSAGPATTLPVMEPLPPGLYEREGIRYQVLISEKSGRPYAKAQTPEGSFEYVPGAISLLSADHREPDIDLELDLVMALAHDPDYKVRAVIAARPDLSLSHALTLAKDSSRRVRRVLGRNPRTPAEALRELAHDEDSWSRCAVASNASASEEVLRRLAADMSMDDAVRHMEPGRIYRDVGFYIPSDESPDFSLPFHHVRAAVAGNPSAPPDILEYLYWTEGTQAHEALARNPSTPPSVLGSLSGYEAVALNPSSPPELLLRLAEQGGKREAEQLILNPNLPEAAWHLMAHNTNWRVRAVVAACPDTPDEALVGIDLGQGSTIAQALDTRARLLEAADHSMATAERTSEPEGSSFEETALSDDDVLRLATDPDPALRIRAARCGSLARRRTVVTSWAWETAGNRIVVGAGACGPADLLATFAHQSAPQVRRAVAGNPATSGTTLTELAADSEARVRRAAASNPSTPSDNQLTLARDTDLTVRLQVARRGDLLDPTALTLAEDEDTAVRITLAMNARQPAASIVQQSKDANADVRVAIANRNDLLDGTAAALAVDKDLVVRTALACNSACPIDALMVLADDPETSVRISLARRSGLPQTVLAQLAVDATPDVRRAVVQNPATPDEIRVSVALLDMSTS